MIHPVFEGVIGHEKQVEILTHVAAHPSGAYLFSGSAGLGKRVIAERFVKRLLSLEKEANVDAHPDFVRLQREEGATEIKIKQVRDLISRMQLTSARGGHRVALIEQADRLNEEAANALLKVVEEPPRAVVFLFLAERADRLPATLRSRLTILPFERVAIDTVAKWLMAQGAREGESLLWARESGGAPGIAKKLLENPSLWKERRESARALVQTLCRATVGVQCAALEKAAQSLEGGDDAESAWRGFLSLLMQECGEQFSSSPGDAARVGRGLIHAWYLAGSSLSPRLALEWTAVQPYLSSNTYLPSSLISSYL